MRIIDVIVGLEQIDRSIVKHGIPGVVESQVVDGRCVGGRDIVVKGRSVQRRPLAGHPCAERAVGHDGQLVEIALAVLGIDNAAGHNHARIRSLL